MAGEQVQETLDAILKRLDHIELKFSENERGHNGDATTVNNPQVQVGPTGVSNEEAGATDYSNVQREFEQIRDSLVRTVLPPYLRVNDSPTGIARECKQTLKILSKTARYAETGLKIIATSTTPTLTEEEIHKIYAVLQAQTNYLQAEYSTLVVQSTFDSETSKVFRQLESNSHTFTDRSLTNIRVAAELAAIRGRTSRGSGSGAPRGRQNSFNSFRSRGRGFHRGTSVFPPRPVNTDPDEH